MSSKSRRRTTKRKNSGGTNQVDHTSQATKQAAKAKKNKYYDRM